MSENVVPYHRPSIGHEEMEAVRQVLESGWLTTGPVAQRFEREFAEFVGAKYALAVNSCTAALHLALDAAGIGRGDEVLVPSYTFTATAEVVTYLGARPVLCDCLPGEFNIDPSDAERFYRVLGLRLGKFGLRLAEDKTKIIRFDAKDRDGNERS